MGDSVKYSKFFENKQEKDKPVENVKPVKEEDNWYTGIVSECAVLNFREKPSKEAKVLGTFNANDELQITDFDREWYKVKSADGKIGYCMRDYIKAVN